MTDRTVQLVGGPLDGMTFRHIDPTSADPGAYMTVPGEMARAVYEPTDGDDPDRWHFQGWIGGEPGDIPEGKDPDDLSGVLGPPPVLPPRAAALLGAYDRTLSKMVDLLREGERARETEEQERDEP